MKMSGLGKTWILDLDGTVLKHNGYKIDGSDSFLAGAREYLEKIPAEDMVVFITSRGKEYKDMTEKFLSENNVRFNEIIYGAPYGERILINDKKPSGLLTAYAFNIDRDNFEKPEIEICESL